MKRLSILLLTVALMFSFGCGDSNHAISVAISPNSALTIVQGDGKTFSASVSHDSKNQGVSWTLSGTGCSSAACGTLTNAGTTSVTYNSPASVSSNLTVTVTASSVSDTSKSQSVTITVVPLPSVTTTSLSDGVQNVAYTATNLAATGGISPYTWSVTSGTLPAGMTLSSGGALSGTPTAVGTSTFTVQVSDSSSPAHTATKSLTLKINPAPLAIVTTSLPGGTMNSVYPGATLQSSGGVAPVTWSVTAGGLPAGLSLTASTGAISGTPSASGTFDFTVTATDSDTSPQTKSRALSITINPALSITTASLANGTVNTAYSATLASSGGTSPVTWSISAGTLPTGLNLVASTGVISGTPTASATSDFSVQATDSSTPAQTAIQALSITVVAAPLAIETASLPNGTIGTAYSATLKATGGEGAVTWSITSGSLPAWASLDTSTGEITGTPSGTPATTDFTVQAADSGTPQQTQTLALSITTVTGGVNNAELNGHYAFSLSGYDAVGGGKIKLIGSFLADGNGSITGGVEDVNTSASGYANRAITGGYYSVGADQRGTLTLTTSQGNSTFVFTLGQIVTGVASVGHIIGSDNNVLAGDFKKQDPTAFSTAAFNGKYAFGISGFESAGRFAAAGVITLDGAGGLSALMDSNDAGNVTSQSTFTGTYDLSVDTTNGRGTMNDTTNGSHMVMYVISSNEVFIGNTDPYSAGPPIFTGSAQKQSGTFTTAAMDNIKTVFMAQSVSSYSGGVPASAYVGLGLFTFSSAGTLTGRIDENDGGDLSGLNKTGMTGTYSLASNGRMTLTVNSKPVPEVFYMISPGKAYVVGTDGAVNEGELKVQSGSSFTNASLSGDFIFGVRPPIMTSSTIDVGVVHLDGAGNVTGISDQNNGGTMSSNPFTDTYNISSDGRVVLSNNIQYIISASKAVMMSTDSSQTDPTLHIIDKQ